MGSAPPTEIPEFARECDKVFEVAAITLHTKKTMFQQSASQVTAEFIVNERR
jgi:hypothetical protein